MANWQILEKSDSFTKADADTIEFRVQVKPEEEKAISYKVRYSFGASPVTPSSSQGKKKAVPGIPGLRVLPD